MGGCRSNSASGKCCAQSSSCRQFYWQVNKATRYLRALVQVLYRLRQHCSACSIWHVQFFWGHRLSRMCLLQCLRVAVAKPMDKSQIFLSHNSRLTLSTFLGNSVNLLPGNFGKINIKHARIYLEILAVRAPMFPQLPNGL